MTPLNLVGQKFGKLLVEEFAPSDLVKTRFVCKCECGKTVILIGSELKRGHHKSCGCSMGKPITTKEYRDHPLYDVWKGMKARCRDKNNIGFPNYGGKGVVACAEWNNDFFSFYNWSLANGYKDGLQIDKDILGDGLVYSPSTCCWVTPARNCQQKKTTKLNFDIVAQIRISPLRRCELSRKYNVNVSTVDKIKQNKIWKV